MSKERFTKETPDIAAEACAWIAQLETGELTAADLDAFREWMQRSPRHAAEIKRLAAASMDLNVLADMAKPLREATEDYQSIVRPGRRQTLFTRSRVATIAIAAGVVLAIGFSLLYTGAAPDEPMLVATAVGDYREVELSDGTMVKLNTDSRIEIAYDDKKRKVRLLTGEAFFDVAHNPARPFFVYAGEKYVRVVGTAFVVRLIENDFEVTVMQGRVELAETTKITGAAHRKTSPKTKESPAGGPAAPLAPITLKAGQSISISAMQKVSAIVALTERDLQRELSWQEGLHDFSNTPLEEVVKEMSRHSPLQIEIADPALHGLKFGGIFRTGETQPLLDALESSFGIDVEYVGDNKVVLSLAAQE